MRAALTLLAAGVALAACGQQKTLRPPTGASLQKKPAAAPATPTASDLLQSRPTDRPGRSDELLTKSQPRTDDPFDQPPQ